MILYTKDQSLALVNRYNALVKTKHHLQSSYSNPPNTPSTFKPIPGRDFSLGTRVRSKRHCVGIR